MANEASGYLDFVATKGFTLRVHYAETYNNASNTSSITITKLQVAGSEHWSHVYYLDGTIQVNGTTVVTMSSYQGTHSVSVNGKDAFYDVNGTLGTISGITRNEVVFAVNVTGHVIGSGGGTGWNTTSESSITLTTISVGYIYIDNGYGFDAYQVYIDNGYGWDLCVAYIDNGYGWDKCG